MFAELMPVIKNRPLTITIAFVADGKIRVCVVPQSQQKDGAINDKVGHRDEVAKIPEAAIQALATPLSLTGTPEELDSGLAATLTTYAASHERLQDGISRATQQITDALKALDERGKAKKTKMPPPAKNDAKDDKPQSKAGSSDPAATLPLNWIAPPAAPAAVSAGDPIAGHQQSHDESGEE